MLKCNIERLSREVEDTKYPCPCSHCSNCPWSQSLDICLRSPSRHRLERRVTFQEPEVELDPSEQPYIGPWPCPFGIHLDSSGVPPFAQGQETVHPLDIPILYPDIGGGCPPEPSIKNIEAWLDWQAHQLDMPHW